MKKFALGCCCVFFILFSFAQQDAKALVQEGIQLHDKGQYDEALKRYDAALGMDGSYYLAHYEKAYTLLAAKRYDECIALSKYILKTFKNGPDNASVYINYGTCLDYLGKASDAVGVYNDGIKQFPKMGLLYFNKAVTLANMGKMDDAMTSIKSSIAFNPYHASSHHVLSLGVREKNKIFGLLASLVFLAIEPEGNRAVTHWQNVQAALVGNAKKTGDRAVTINLDPATLSGKEPDEDNFRSLELLMSLSAGTDFDEKNKNETAAEKLQRKLELVVSMLDETGKNKQGFAWTYYVPFFISLKKEGYLKTFSHVVYSSSGDTANRIWLNDNAVAVEEFTNWFKNYWKKSG